MVDITPEVSKLSINNANTTSTTTSTANADDGDDEDVGEIPDMDGFEGDNLVEDDNVSINDSVYFPPLRP